MVETKGFVGLKLNEVLDKQNVHSDLKLALPGIFKECCAISRALRTTRVTSAGSSNTFGEEQLSVDLLAENKLREWAKACQAVRAVSSEEATDLVEVNPSGSLIVCWDPLDGSSIVDCNWSVASIFGIWQVGQNGLEWKGADTLIDATGRQQVASILVIYGPRTTALVCVGGVTFDFQLDPDGSGLGPDVYQIFVKGHGIFCNPASTGAPAKLRVLYEVAPIALLVEAAGGCSSSGNSSALDVVSRHNFNAVFARRLVVKKMDQRTAFCCGSEEEVRKVEKALRF
ncbi:hypothetical protein Emed_001011 [Eimeria media]